MVIAFLEWLNTRGTDIGEARQGDLEEWLAAGASTRRHVASFIKWVNASGQTIGLTMPKGQSGTRPVLSQNVRLRLLRTYFHDTTVPIDVRIAGLFLLLFATPVTRIVGLTPNDFSDDRASLTLGSVAVPLPVVLQELVVEQFASPKLRGSAAHGPVVVWLFPGRLPGQHLTAQVIRERLHEHGLPKLGPGRNGAVAALVRELPAPVAGQVCGIGSGVAARWAAELGVDRGSYPRHRNQGRR